jgi:protocatechuate 3,4-dioxygenase beta subunit
MDIDRRELLRQFCYGIAAIPLLHACGSTSDGVTVDSPTSSGDTGAGSDSGGDSGSTEWASGGTGAMTDKATYPDPFTDALTACTLVATTTAGPCTTATDLAREDVSEGWTGLPVRFALKVVNTSCAPIVGATVKIWHTNALGSYSGQTPNNGFCLKTASYSSMNFMRGVQTTSSAGTVFFDTCFPGWYPGRAIHIHFQIKMGNTSTRVSQLFFPENLTTQIFASHADYKQYGQPDTLWSNDGVLAGVSSADRDRLTLTIARMTDGAMLASKVVTVA